MKCSRTTRRGSALIVALWAIIMLSMIVSSLAFQMHLEARLASHYRKRVKAKQLSLAGMEFAKFMLYKSVSSSQDDEEEYGEQFFNYLLNLRNSVGVSGYSTELGEGTFTIDILPEQGRRNVNTMTYEDWQEMLEQAGLPKDRWAEFIDPFMDWVDTDNNNRRKGAEENDDFYSDVDYKVKNGPIDTVDEMLMIKNWDRNILYGGPGLEDGDPPIRGIASLITTWGNGKVNVNTASRDVLLTMP
ncbi:MAG: general secretion pathway protein K, partial [Kiritimatiellia bacterium]